jgi:hypothetical protein
MSAGGLTRTLTQAEFEHLLQRAAERDVFTEARLFTLGELVAAGQEIGIDPLSVQAVYAEYQQRTAQPLRPVREQPIGSRLQLYKQGDVLELAIPPVRRRRMSELLFSLAGAGGLVWAGFATGLPALISPFGVLLLAFAGYRWRRGDQTSGFQLRLFRDGSGELLRISGRHTSSYPLIAGQVHARLATVAGGSGSEAERFHIVALDHATKTHALMADYTHPERAWVVDEIESWLGRGRG